MGKLRLFIFIFLVLHNQSYGRTTYEQILHNKPKIDKKYALKLSIYIDKVADKYKVPANVLASIAMVESSYILNAVNKHSNDYGIMQVNEYNIKAYKFDKLKLTSDLEYSISAGAKIFKWFYKTYDTLEEATKRYNCGTKKTCTTWEGPKNYWKKVKKYL